MFFDSIFTQDSLTAANFFIVFGVSLVAGLIFSVLCKFNGSSSKSFFISTSLIPPAVAMVIMLVNGNIGAGVAVAGAFGLVRFRSAQGSAKEICSIFIAMAAGLAFGMGYLAYGAIFITLSGIILFILGRTGVLETNCGKTEKIINITVPEDLNYPEAFNEPFAKYTVKYDLIKVKTVNMGSMFKLTYRVKIKNPNEEKDLIDELRLRNGNLEICVSLESDSAVSL